jgi:FkbM family methyltransferase
VTPVACALCVNEFGRYAIPLSSSYRPAAQTVLRGDVWERDTVELLRAHADRDVVHAGTYFGDFLPGVSAVMKPGRTVYAFEPNAENHACAEWTIVLNGLDNVRLQRAALGDANTTRQMQTSWNGQALGGASRIADGEGPGYAYINAVRLDDVLPPGSDIGVLQLDVEGFEEPALAGALGTISRCRPMLILETVPEAFIASRLAPLGYRQSGVVCGNAVFQTATRCPYRP